MAGIISLIDSISFQTNILRLNAAVEAARAGEQDRSVAVLAQEVWALALPGTQLSRDLRDLAGATLNTLSYGSKRAHQTGDAMLAIIGSTTRVTERILEFSAEADAPSNRIRWVNQAIAQIQASSATA
jgi:methyl-accepting chemotaxis protein